MEAEELVWEFFETEKTGWTVLAKNNLDEDGNLKGIALETQQGGSFKFRQTPKSKVGTGDSNGTCKALFELPLD